MSKYRRSESTTRTPAEDLKHASADCQRGIVTKVSTLRIPAPTLAPTQLLLFDVIRRNRPVSFSWAISEVTVVDNATALASALVRGKAIAVSDGSFKNDQGTAEFVIEGDSRNERVVGVNIIPGEPEYQPAYRSEIGGIAGILESLHCLCEAHAIRKGAVEIGLDGEQAMKVEASEWPLDPGSPNFDMLQHVRGLIKALPIETTFRWMASHQDKHKPFAQLDHWEQLNVECNGLAKKFWIPEPLHDPGLVVSSLATINGLFGLMERS